MEKTIKYLLFGICICLAIFLVLLCIKAISNFLVSRNREKYFTLNKTICTKLQKRGEELIESHHIYQEYIKELGFNKIVRCSNSVVSGSRQNPTKYIIKYSNLDRKIEDIERLEFISDHLNNCEIYSNKMAHASNEIKSTLPLFHKIFTNKKRLPYTICGIDYSISTIQKPSIYFSYTSPAGRASHNNAIHLSSELISDIINDLSSYINKKGHAKLQRGMMTNDLREAIKLRDNYTCCECGNSVYKEPNLLLEVDHIIPISKGGKTEASNLQTLCWKCNREKANK